MQKPTLHVFLISHYCEKARWALEHCGIEYQVNLLSPIAHARKAKQIGAKRSSLPILQTASQVIQGSAPIIEWANAQAHQNKNQGLLITPESSEIETRLDKILGFHVRRWFYSEALLDCPETVEPVFAEGAGFFGRTTLKLAWPKVVATMIKLMDLGTDQEAESRAIVSAELDWLDSLIADNRKYLVDNTLSNADIAAASLIAPMLGPDKHPATHIVKLPPRVEATAAEWNDRPFANWVMQLYQTHR